MSATDPAEDELIELAFFRDLEVDQLIAHGLLCQDYALASPLDRELLLQHDELTLRIISGPSYPAVSPTCQVDNVRLSRESVIELRSRLREIINTAKDVNDLVRWREVREVSFWEPIMVVFQLAQETACHIKNLRSKSDPSPRIDNGLSLNMKEGSSTFTSGEQASRLLGKSTKEIMEKIPPEFRVLHVEEVLRSDLHRAFNRHQARIQALLSRESLASLRRHVPHRLRHSNRKEDLIEHILRPCMTFHGTQRQYVPSIVRNGFLKPGSKDPATKQTHEARCGSTYGRGIYSSPSAEFSLSYSDWQCHATKPTEFFGLKLIVCATLMGRSRQMFAEDNWRTQSEPYEGADSHVANCEFEYIVFNPAQIIPVYVVHMDWGPDNAAHFHDLPTDPTNWVKTTKTHPKLVSAEALWPDDIRRKKQEAYARAAKYFPYGYGPATGGKFVVEEVGEIDEDDEVYGDYQALRGEETDKKSNIGFWSWVKAAEEEDGGVYDAADEYRNEARDYGPEDWDNIPDPETLKHQARHSDDDDDDNDLGLGILSM